MLTVNRVLKDDEIIRIADSIIALQESEDTTIPALKKQLADTECGIENILNAIQQGILTSSTKERLETLEREKESLQTAIAQVELQKPKYMKEQIVSWINQFKYGDADSIEYQKHIIDTFVNAIYLFDDKIVITYNFKGGTETITMKDIEAAYGSDITLMSPVGAKRRFDYYLTTIFKKSHILFSSYSSLSYKINVDHVVIFQQLFPEEYLSS